MIQRVNFKVKFAKIVSIHLRVNTTSRIDITNRKSLSEKFYVSIVTIGINNSFGVKREISGNNNFIDLAVPRNRECHHLII